MPVTRIIKTRRPPRLVDPSKCATHRSPETRQNTTPPQARPQKQSPFTNTQGSPNMRPRTTRDHGRRTTKLRTRTAAPGYEAKVASLYGVPNYLAGRLHCFQPHLSFFQIASRAFFHFDDTTPPFVALGNSILICRFPIVDA